MAARAMANRLDATARTIAPSAWFKEVRTRETLNLASIVAVSAFRLPTL